MSVNVKKPDGTNRVVITGMGAVSPAGLGVEALWDKIVTGQRCIKTLDRFDPEGYGFYLAGQVPDFDPVEAGISKKEARRFGRFIQYAIIASDEAMRQSGLDMETEDPTRVACSFGTGIGGLEEFQKGCVTLETKGASRVNPLFIPLMISNMAAGELSIRYGIKGECTCVVTACASGAHSIGEGYRAIRHGYADVALVGGTEEAVNPICLAGFGRLGALTNAEDPELGSMPFDARRSGFVPAEGAGALVIESLEHALARGAEIVAEIAGFGSTGDAYHMTAPEPNGDGALRAMRQALAEGGFTGDDLGHLNAHGTSTPANDSMESAALASLLGDRLSEVPVTSVKGSTGHTLGAAGALEAIVTALSVKNECVPPTVGFAEPDPDCPVYVPTEALEGRPQKVALSNSLGFGGHNASLAIAPF